MMQDSPPHGGVRAVIFDVSGTVLDFGSRAPARAFVELFARHGVAITMDEARKPMGAHKIDHIRAILSEPSIAPRWEKAHGSRPTAEILDALYAEFCPLQIETLKGHCDVIPGVPQVTLELRQRQIKIASTTGFDKAMMVDLIPQAIAGGYSPELWVTPDVVGKGRPAPWMAFYIAKQLDVYPMKTFVKVGDTPVDVAEGHAAGMWTVSVVRSGNEVGLSSDELEALPAEERNARLSRARARLASCGPHYIIDTVADLPPVVDAISARLARGERP
ncbi:MAG TPA: phosphonoacetaldehyde hydrolase [Verrucomicrobiae bacterium]|jgi:phosphonoacetaldehyde hydrolase|nr:phosphonoacetaldehyde hydrolase [Verrucomicrobiae bacterium]